MENANPLISVIMNCYNGESFLQESVNSVLAQTYTNWEIIFWDNCSEDSSIQIIESFHDERIKCFKAFKHTSLGEARNLALAKTSGRYVAFLDVDDLWLPDFLMQGIRSFQTVKGIGLFYSNYYLFNSQSKWLYNDIQYNRIECFNDLLSSYRIGMSAVMVDNILIKQNKLQFNNDYSLIEDYDFYLRIAYLQAVYYYSKPLALYRMHSSSLTCSMKEGWGKELTALYIYLTNSFLSDREKMANRKGLKWLKVRCINAEINDAIEKAERIKVFKLVMVNIFRSYKLLFPLLYIFIGERRYYKLLYRVRKNIYQI